MSTDTLKSNVDCAQIAAGKTAEELSKELKNNIYLIYSILGNSEPEASNQAKADIKHLNKTDAALVKETLKEVIGELGEKYNAHNTKALAELKLESRVHSNKLKALMKQSKSDIKTPTEKDKADGCKAAVTKLIDFAITLGHSDLKQDAQQLVGSLGKN